jgi:hypothetical protein
MQHTIGIDVSKDALDIHRRMDGATLQLGNDRAWIQALAQGSGLTKQR